MITATEWQKDDWVAPLFTIFIKCCNLNFQHECCKTPKYTSEMWNDWVNRLYLTLHIVWCGYCQKRHVKIEYQYVVLNDIYMQRHVINVVHLHCSLVQNNTFTWTEMRHSQQMTLSKSHIVRIWLPAVFGPQTSKSAAVDVSHTVTEPCI